MRPDNTTENEEEAGDQGAEAAPEERRSSIVTLQDMLKKASHSPFHDNVKDVPAAAAPDVTDLLGLRQDGAAVDSAQTNLFYAYYLESHGKGHVTEDAGIESSEDANIKAIFLPPAEFQSSPLDLQPDEKTEENGDKYPDLQKDLTRTPLGDLFHTPSQSASANRLHAPPTQNLSRGEDLILSAGAQEADLLLKSPSNPEEHLNPFHAASTSPADLQFGAFPKTRWERDPSTQTKQNELFGKASQENRDLFASPNSVDPFPSPISKDLFQAASGLDDPCATPPSERRNPFRDVSNGPLDIFQPLPSKTTSRDVFQTSSSQAASSGPSLHSVPETEPESLPAVRPKWSNTSQDIVPTPPQGHKRAFLQPTPFSQARDLSGQSPSEMTHVQTFRRPPKPLPRTRPPRTNGTPGPEKPPVPEKPPTPVKPIESEPAPPKTPQPAFRPLPKPPLSRRPKTPEGKPMNPENFFEDILLIGQERCVEDWPEDSPELHPEFKPSGTLRLRRESMKFKSDSDGGSGEDSSGMQSKKKDKKFRMSLLSRRGSKDKFPDDTKEGKHRTLSLRKSSKEYLSEVNNSAEENDDGLEYSKKPLKTKVNQLLRRASTFSSVQDGKHMNGDFPQESMKQTVLDGSAGEEDDGGEALHEEKKKNKVKIKFVPHRGFAISIKKTDEEPKGAYGYTPRKGSKSQEELFGSYTPRKESQDDDFEDIEDMKGHSLQYTAKKKATKMKVLQMGRRSSKEEMLDESSPHIKKSSFSAEELDDEAPHWMEHTKLKKSKHKGANQHKSGSRSTYDSTGHSEMMESRHDAPQQGVFAEEGITGQDFRSPGRTYAGEEAETCRPKKSTKLKGFKKYKAKRKVTSSQSEDPAGVASDIFLSEAAQAEWQAAQQDGNAMDGFDDDDEGGDTDSLMEWWYTVEQWDEVPSDDENQVMMEDESKSFSALADKVQRGLRVFHKVFTERAESLWFSLVKLHTITDELNEYHQKAKKVVISGGTTSAVGGAAALAGVALAPFTLGVSLFITAIGVGVAAAGGITSASAAISDNVHNTQDRKKMETVLQEYEAHLLDIGKILHFIDHGVYKLRGHPFLRSGTQHYSEDWEIRRAVQMISQVDKPVMRAAELTDAAVAKVRFLFKGMDEYFVTDSRELKKGCNKDVVSQIKQVASELNDALVELNAIREELQVGA